MDEIKFDTINDLGKKEAAAHDYISSRKKELESNSRERDMTLFLLERQRNWVCTQLFSLKKRHGMDLYLDKVCPQTLMKKLI